MKVYPIIYFIFKLKKILVSQHVKFVEYSIQTLLSCTKATHAHSQGMILNCLCLMEHILMWRSLMLMLRQGIRLYKLMINK